ncbi:hypothetical protein [Sphingomonas rubra]|uniref:hypothetical protein n=1 Tax=Sphingomonas rubra TaxID=634430 RepID=UPI000AA3A2BE|nr:hypothetical protein [Sphingomonas rubra]
MPQAQRAPSTAIDGEFAQPATNPACTTALPALTISKRGSWFQSPHVCIPANWEKGSLVILVEVDAWSRLLSAGGGDVTAAKKTALRHAETRGSWVPDFGEPAVLIKW